MKCGATARTQALYGEFAAATIVVALDIYECELQRMCRSVRLQCYRAGGKSAAAEWAWCSRFGSKRAAAVVSVSMRTGVSTQVWCAGVRRTECASDASARCVKHAAAAGASAIGPADT